MLEFKIIRNLKPNKDILEIINNCTVTIQSDKIKQLLKTNLQFIEPTKYFITYPFTLTIYEYCINEINNKPFYIKEYNNKYNLQEILHILKKLTKSL